jgi:endoglucanase
MARVREVVEWILQADMYCIVNIHWDGGWIMNLGNETEYQLTDDVRSKFASYWQQIATAFADFSHQLVFEALNEEGRFYVNGDTTAAPDYAALNELNQLFVDTVRESGGYNETRNLLIAGFATDIENTVVADFGIPTDPAGAGKLLLSIHYYTPFTFCGLEEPANWYEDVWTYPATTWGTAEEQAELQKLFGQLADFCEDRSIPVILGEFAVVLGDGEYAREQASRILWMKSVFETTLSYGMVPILWDTGTEISREDGSLSAELTQVITELGL